MDSLPKSSRLLRHLYRPRGRVSRAQQLEEALLDNQLICLEVAQENGPARKNYMEIGMQLVHGKRIFSSYEKAHDFLTKHVHEENRSQYIPEDIKELMREDYANAVDPSKLRDDYRHHIKTMNNPYDPEFLELERRIAKVIVHSIEPRVLQNLIDHNVRIVVSNEQDRRKLFICRRSKLNAPLKGLHIHGGAYMHQIIAVAAKDFDPTELALSLCHEAEHVFDKTNYKGFFEKNYADIDEKLYGDRLKFDALYKSISELKAPNDEMLKLIEMLGLKDVEFQTAHKELLAVLAHFHKRIKTLAPLEPADECRAYPTKIDRITEIPAVMVELKNAYGESIVEELFPELYKVARRHRLEHPAMPFSSPNGRS